MQMQSDNANAATPNLVPFRQCKLTELLFSNSLASNQQHGGGAHKAPQKAIMIVTADPLGDFNATSQILRYSALAREVTVPRIPSVTSTILSGTTAGARSYFGGTGSGRTTPSALHEELETALAAIAQLRADLEVTQVRLEEETFRRIQTEESWKAAEMRIDEIEAEVREDVWSEMESKLVLEQRRWRAARDAELDAQDSHMDKKLEILTRGMSIYEDEEAEKENRDQGSQEFKVDFIVDEESRVQDLEDENAKLRERIALVEREKEVQRSPSKKMRILKTRKWEGSGMGLDEIV
jgi:hypothetical protein